MRIVLPKHRAELLGRHRWGQRAQQSKSRQLGRRYPLRSLSAFLHSTGRRGGAIEGVGPPMRSCTAAARFRALAVSLQVGV